jgi:hypothetical protein
LRGLIFVAAVLAFSPTLFPQPVPRQPMQLGVDADDWNNQINNPSFERSLRKMQVDFISWHIQPEEEANPAHMREIANFCRRNRWHYLFNTEVGNYRRNEPLFRHPDGTYRYDLADQTLQQGKDDPYFIGVVYDESDLVQAMLGMPDGKRGSIEPYLSDTRRLTPVQAYFAVSDAAAKLEARYKAYGKRVIFEMTFPDNPFAFARAGALLAPKLLKENFNDLMYAVYRGAALQYKSRELWACIDLWFLDKFPTAGKYGPGSHTPAELLRALQFAYAAGLDSIYIEQVKALVDDRFELTEYGNKVVEFQTWRKSHAMGNWRVGKIDYVVKRFPDGYWGQSFSTFIPDHPYGSWTANPYHPLDSQWFKTLNELSHHTIPTDADTWNAQGEQFFSNHPYQANAGLPPMIVIDPFGSLPLPHSAKMIDLSPK